MLPLNLTTPHHMPCELAADDMTIETYYYGHQSIFMEHCRTYLCSTHISALISDRIPSELWPLATHIQKSHSKVGLLQKRERKWTNKHDWLHYLPHNAIGDNIKTLKKNHSSYQSLGNQPNDHDLSLSLSLPIMHITQQWVSSWMENHCAWPFSISQETR